MLNKTMIALAISASFTGTALAADKYQKYNFTNQVINKASQQITKN